MTSRRTFEAKSKRLAYEIASISAYLDEVHQIWASALGLSHPQLKILMALVEGDGASVSAVAKMIHVEPSFVTSQSKVLERKGLLYRRTSSADGRVVELSLSESICRQLKTLSEQQNALEKFIFKGFAADQTADFMTILTTLRERMEKVRHKAALDCLCAVLPKH